MNATSTWVAPRPCGLFLKPHLFRKGGATHMHGHSTDQEKATHEPTRRADDSATGWQTPEYAIVDTALEVTGYRLADR